MTSRAAILGLSKTLADGQAASEAAQALARDDFDAACTAVLAGLVRGERPVAATVGPLLRGVDDPVLLCALLGRLGPEAVDAVVAALEPGPLTPVQEAYLFFAAAQALNGAKPPPRLKALLRLRSRGPLHEEDADLVHAAMDLIADPSEKKREPPDKAGRARIDEAKGWMTGPLDKVLPEDALLGPPLPGTRKAEKVPRNAPCPCGSGKKFKACHGGAEAEGPRGASDLDARLKVASPELLPRHVDALRLIELVRLDFAAMTTLALGVAYDRLCGLARLDVAERALEVLVQRPDLGKATPDDYRLDFILFALEQSDPARADRQRAQLKEPQRWDALHALERAWLGGDVPVSQLEAVVKESLGAADELQVRELVWVLLRRAPALGILAARGALPTAGKLDGRELLFAAQDARDRLLLPPDEPGWAAFDALYPASGDARADAEADRAALDLRARELAKKLEASQKRLTDAEGRLHALTSTAGPAGEAPEQDKGKLQQKVNELKELLKEGNRERTELRRTLQHVSGQLAEESQVEAPPASEPVEEQEEGDGLDAPRGVMAPLFLKAAADALERLPKNIARDAVLKVSEVAAGVPTAWREVKRMQHVPGYLSVRVGIHHRVLFHLDGATLQVDEVIHRQDLDATVRRLGR